MDISGDANNAFAGFKSYLRKSCYRRKVGTERICYMNKVCKGDRKDRNKIAVVGEVSVTKLLRYLTSYFFK
jgi:hypothetical protein